MSHMWTVEVESEKWPGMADIRFRDVQTVSQFGTLPFMARNKQTLAAAGEAGAKQKADFRGGGDTIHQDLCE